MRRFRFSLLMLLVVLTITAVAIVWGQQYTELQHLRASHRANLEAQLREHERQLSDHNVAIERLNGRASTHYQWARQNTEHKIAKLKKELSELDN